MTDLLRRIRAILKNWRPADPWELWSPYAPSIPAQEIVEMMDGVP